MKQFVEAALFDFNGTMFDDDDINNISWGEIIDEVCGQELYLSNDDSKYIGAKDSIFLKYLFSLTGKEISDEEADEWAEKKEIKYRHYCTEWKRDKLRKGLEDVLNYIKENNIPLAMATNSIKSNVDFYFKNVQLDRWFDRKYVVYDDGNHFNKITMYRECARRLGVNIENCIIFEDSPGSVRNAIEAGCPRIIRISEDNMLNYPEIKQNIRDFSELDYSCFEL
ncbi:MAG: HAD family phosphatase [Erysipelotrichaceae bacterium]|nr:HAD family phosphatase [Erysipelotrichaceae bacterium]